MKTCSLRYYGCKSLSCPQWYAVFGTQKIQTKNIMINQQKDVNDCDVLLFF